MLSAYLRWQALTQTPYANGWDSYFYLVQLKTLLTEGQMHSRDLSLIYPFMVVIKGLGVSYISAYKLTAAGLASAVSALFVLIGYRWSGQASVAAGLGAWSVFSPELTYFAAHYPKNLLGIVILLITILLVNRPVWPILLLGIGFFGHRLTALLGIGYVLVFYILKYGNWKYLLYGTAGVILIALLGIMLPGLFSIYDLERFNNLLQAKPQLAPLSLISTLQTAELRFWWKFEILFSLMFVLFGVIFLIRKKDGNRHTVALLGIALILIFPFLQWSVEGLAFRLVQVFVLLSPLLLASVNLPKTRFWWVVSSGLLACAFFSWRSYNPPQHDPPYALYQAVSQRTLKHLPKATELVIAHKSLAEFFTFTTGIDALPWLPEYTVNKGKLWRISSGFEATELTYRSQSNQVYRLGLGYALLPEEAWQKCFTKWQESGNPELLKRASSWKNPHQIRPGYLLKNKTLP
jgi:MFS family permease